jgi:hypothetical protein
MVPQPGLKPNSSQTTYAALKGPLFHQISCVGEYGLKLRTGMRTGREWRLPSLQRLYTMALYLPWRNEMLQ